MNVITENGHVNPARFCECCDLAIAGDGRMHDGEALCDACWADRVECEAREELEEAEIEIAGAKDELDAAQAEFDRSMRALELEFAEEQARLREVLDAWRRRAARANKKMEGARAVQQDRLLSRPAPEWGRDLSDDGPFEPPFWPMAPIVGGGPDGPTDADWADYRAHFDAEERDAEMRDAEGMDDGPEARWGYE